MPSILSPIPHFPAPASMLLPRRANGLPAGSGDQPQPWTRSSKLLPCNFTSDVFLLAGSRSWTDKSSRRTTSPTRIVASIKPRSVSSMGDDIGGGFRVGNEWERRGARANARGA